MTSHFSQLPRARSLLALAALVAGVGTTGLARAQFGFLYEWNKPGDGGWSVNSNWTPSGVPDAANEAAVLGLAGSRKVTLADANYSINSLQASAGSVELVSFADRQFSVNALDVTSAAESPTSLTLSDGKFVVHGQTTVNGAGVSQTGLYVGGEQTLTTTGPLVVGSTGDGRFVVGSGTRTSNLFVFPTQGVVESGSVIVGQGPASSGTVGVAGDWTMGQLVIGEAGEGQFEASGTPNPPGPIFGARATVHCSTLSIAALPSSDGVLTVTAPFLALSPADFTVEGNAAIGGTPAAAGGSGRVVLDSDAILDVGGALKLWPGSTLAISEGSSVAVGGAAALGGVLHFEIDPGAGFGAEFQVLTAGAVSGQFQTLELPPLSSSLKWITHYNAASVVLEIGSALAADFDENGVVEAADLTAWTTNASLTSGATHMQGDANADGAVDGADLVVWQRQFGTVAGPFSAHAAPEPRTLALVIVAWAFFSAPGSARRSK